MAVSKSADAAKGEGAAEARPVETAAVAGTPFRGAAAGFGAIASTLRHLRRETGLWRGGRALLRMNQPDGYDCAGCAWPEPDPERRPALEFCENGAKHFADEATRRHATAELFARWTIEELRAKSDLELGQCGRLVQPLVRRAGAAHYEPIDWDAAFALIAAELNALPSPDAALFYTSGRTSNEAAFLFQLFARRFGTNNLPDCSNMCHESSGVGMTEVIGVGKGTVGLDDFAQSDAIFILGQNPGTNHPRMLTTLREAARRGCPIVAINPLREPGLVRFAHPQKVGDLLGGGTAIATQYLQIKVGGDVALLKGIMKEVLAEEERRPGQVVDGEFVRTHTEGFDAFRAALDRVAWDDIVAESGVGRDQIRQAAATYVKAERVIACWAMGLTQHKHAVANVQEIVNLMLLRGNLGRPGAGLCPVRGHSNVQGDRTMGITPRPKRDFLAALAREFSFEPPARPGLDTVDAIRAMRDGRARLLCALGGNFYSATPDSDLVGRALAGCALTVHVSTKLNRSHLFPGAQALILPCLGRSEIDRQAGGPQFVTVEDSMSMVHRSQGALEPASAELLSEPALVARLARAALGPKSGIDWDWLVADYDRIRDCIARVVPGFADFNRRVRSPAGFRLPNGARERRFATAGGAARFTVHELPRLAVPPGRLLMMTIRSHDQFNTTVYGLDDRYRGIRGERRVVLLHREDLAALGLVENQLVDLVSEFRGEERVAPRFIALPYDIPRGCAATYFPEANVLVPLDSTADKSNTPTSKSVIIRLQPAAGPCGEVPGPGACTA